MKSTNWALPFAVPTQQAFIVTWQRPDNPPSTFIPVVRLTLLLNFTAEVVGWYRISLQGLLRLYEKPLIMISATNITCGTGNFWERKGQEWPGQLSSCGYCDSVFGLSAVGRVVATGKRVADT